MESLFFKVSYQVLLKLRMKHRVTLEEVGECFFNCKREWLEDVRMDHCTDPPTLWFIAKTDCGRKLKTVFIDLGGNVYELKTAYEPNNKEVKIYEKYARKIN